MISANPSASTLVDFGGPDECRWLDMHQTGNSREHYAYWYLTEQYHAKPTRPSLNGEPYYSGLHALGEDYAHGKNGDTPEDDMYVRSGMYGSLLSGGFAGYIYGCEGIWQSTVDGEEGVKMWDSFQWSSGRTVQHLKTFAFVKGDALYDLIPNAEHLVPNRTEVTRGYEGWIFAAGNPDKTWFMIYFEANCAETIELRGTKEQYQKFKATWFDPRTGEWSTDTTIVQTPVNSLLPLPPRPDPRLDWCLMLEAID